MAVVSRPLKTERAPSWRQRVFRFTPLVTVVTYVLAILAIAVLVQHAIVWGQRRIDDLRYGFPRSVQISDFIGNSKEQGTPTQIIALNMYGQVSVLVLPGGDVNSIQVLQGPYLVGRDGPYEAPLPALRDITGDGQADLLVTVRGEVIVYVNEHGTFRLITPEERAALAGLENGEPGRTD